MVASIFEFHSVLCPKEGSRIIGVVPSSWTWMDSTIQIWVKYFPRSIGHHLKRQLFRQKCVNIYLFKKVKWNKYFLCVCKRKWSCLSGLLFHQPLWIRNCRKRPRAHPEDKFHERTFFERRMQIKNSKTINFMLVACFNCQQKIEIICQVLIQIALIYFDLCLGHGRTTKKIKGMLNPSFVEVFPRELLHIHLGTN